MLDSCDIHVFIYIVVNKEGTYCDLFISFKMYKPATTGGKIKLRSVKHKNTVINENNEPMNSDPHKVQKCPLRKGMRLKERGHRFYAKLKTVV